MVHISFPSKKVHKHLKFMIVRKFIYTLKFTCLWSPIFFSFKPVFMHNPV